MLNKYEKKQKAQLHSKSIRIYFITLVPHRKKKNRFLQPFK